MRQNEFELAGLLVDDPDLEVVEVQKIPCASQNSLLEQRQTLMGIKARKTSRVKAQQLLSGSVDRVDLLLKPIRVR